MEQFLPTDISVMVLRYLAGVGCESSVIAMLEEMPCLKFLVPGQPPGLSKSEYIRTLGRASAFTPGLQDVLKDYARAKTIVSEMAGKEGPNKSPIRLVDSLGTQLKQLSTRMDKLEKMAERDPNIVLIEVGTSTEEFESSNICKMDVEIQTEELPSLKESSSEEEENVLQTFNDSEQMQESSLLCKKKEEGFIKRRAKLSTPLKLTPNKANSADLNFFLVVHEDQNQSQMDTTQVVNDNVQLTYNAPEGEIDAVASEGGTNTVSEIAAFVENAIVAGNADTPKIEHAEKFKSNISALVEVTPNLGSSSSKSPKVWIPDDSISPRLARLIVSAQKARAKSTQINLGRKSFSSPRKKNHVRSLFFSTPPRSKGKGVAPSLVPSLGPPSSNYGGKRKHERKVLEDVSEEPQSKKRLKSSALLLDEDQQQNNYKSSAFPDRNFSSKFVNESMALSAKRVLDNHSGDNPKELKQQQQQQQQPLPQILEESFVESPIVSKCSPIPDPSMIKIPRLVLVSSSPTKANGVEPIIDIPPPLPNNSPPGVPPPPLVSPAVTCVLEDGECPDSDSPHEDNPQKSYTNKLLTELFGEMTPDKIEPEKLKKDKDRKDKNLKINVKEDSKEKRPRRKSKERSPKKSSSSSKDKNNSTSSKDKNKSKKSKSSSLETNRQEKEIKESRRNTRSSLDAGKPSSLPIPTAASSDKLKSKSKLPVEKISPPPVPRNTSKDKSRTKNEQLAPAAALEPLQKEITQKRQATPLKEPFLLSFSILPAPLGFPDPTPTKALIYELPEGNHTIQNNSLITPLKRKSPPAPPFQSMIPATPNPKLMMMMHEDSNSFSAFKSNSNEGFEWTPTKFFGPPPTPGRNLFAEGQSNSNSNSGMITFHGLESQLEPMDFLFESPLDLSSPVAPHRASSNLQFNEPEPPSQSRSKIIQVDSQSRSNSGEEIHFQIPKAAPKKTSPILPVPIKKKKLSLISEPCWSDKPILPNTLPPIRRKSKDLNDDGPCSVPSPQRVIQTAVDPNPEFNSHNLKFLVAGVDKELTFSKHEPLLSLATSLNKVVETKITPKQDFRNLLKNLDLNKILKISKIPKTS